MGSVRDRERTTPTMTAPPIRLPIVIGKRLRTRNASTVTFQKPAETDRCGPEVRGTTWIRSDIDLAKESPDVHLWRHLSGV